MDYKRKLNKKEEVLLNFLVNRASLELSSNWRDDIIVEPMDDGGMGSLKLFLQSNDNSSRLFGKKASECFFLDEDGVKVIASLNLDKNGEVFELDIWKTDYSPLIRIPNEFD